MLEKVNKSNHDCECAFRIRFKFPSFLNIQALQCNISLTTLSLYVNLIIYVLLGVFWKNYWLQWPELCFL